MRKTLFIFVFLLTYNNIFSENSVFCKNYFSYLQKIGTCKFRLWIADNKAKREEGLKGVSSSQLKSKEGMIFVFLHAQKVSFWMKDTPLPLDIAFLDRKGYVLNMDKLHPFSLNPKVSKGAVMYVIEAKAGMLTKNLKVGQKLDLPNHLYQNCR